MTAFVKMSSGHSIKGGGGRSLDYITVGNKIKGNGYKGRFSDTDCL